MLFNLNDTSECTQFGSTKKQTKTKINSILKNKIQMANGILY